MSFNNITPGKNAPESVNVIIEIPAHSGPVKYEVDKETGALHVDRFLNTAMHYPANYGYVPQTLSDDGDPVDVLVITNAPLVHGCVIEARPIGMLEMTDEKGVDAKLIAVPLSKLDASFAHYNSPADVSDSLKNMICHFFERYKDLEKDKWVKIGDWRDKAAAHQEILDSIKRYQG